MEAAVGTGGCQAGREEDIASSGSAGAAYRPDPPGCQPALCRGSPRGSAWGRRWGDGSVAVAVGGGVRGEQRQSGKEFVVFEGEEGRL